MADPNPSDFTDFNLRDFNPDGDVPQGTVPDPDVEMERSLTPRPSTQTLFNTASKRRRSLSPEPGPSGSRPAKKARQILSRRRVKPKAPADWHLKKGEIPADSEKTKVCMLPFSIFLLLISIQLALETHIRALWRLTDQNATPPKVTDADKLQYNERFTSAASVKTSVQQSLNSNATDINDASARVQELLDSLPEGRSTIANNIRCILQQHLELMHRSISFLGLARWAPDVLGGDPESMYNILHEQIALMTFQQVAGAFGYAHLGINLQLVRNFVILRKFYRNFVYAHMRRIAKIEAKAPGSVAKGNEMTNTWKCRREV